jgi:hypothetical protein
VEHDSQQNSHHQHHKLRDHGRVCDDVTSAGEHDRRRALARFFAISSFSDEVSVAPGDCSPSRSVVSKIRT